MSTTVDPREALDMIDSISGNMPISTTLTEVQLAVERLSFADFATLSSGSDSVHAEIDLMFRDEISSGMVGFLHWMAGNDSLSLLVGEQGRIFLDRCISKYSNVDEVQVVTAIPLESDHRERLVSQLRAVYPEPARILFSTSPLVYAGFLIADQGRTVVDRTLRTHIATTVPRVARMEDIKMAGSTK